MPMPISSPEEYEAVVDACWFKEDHRISQGYVKILTWVWNRLSNLSNVFYARTAWPVQFLILKIRRCWKLSEPNRFICKKLLRINA
jgi:hypothetical protein